MPRKRSGKEIDGDLRRLAQINPEGADISELIHELQVYHEELNAQNNELQRTHADLEEAKHRYVELYDFAPNGYLTLDPHGLIRQLNLTAARLIGRPREEIEGMPLLVFVVAADRARFLEFLRRCRHDADGTTVAEELALKVSGESRRVQLLCRRRPGKPGNGEFLTAMLDVSELRRLEADREYAVLERAALAGRLIAVQEDMRQRFARDLHDNVGQQMTALRLKLAALAVRAPEDFGGELRDVHVQLEELDRQLDFLATELRPAVLDAGIVTAVRDFVREWSATCGIQVGFQSLDMERKHLHPDVETHLYRVTQEALHNVYKHAQARHVSVLLERRASEVVLVVEDDGRGFDPAVRGRGLGLVGMRERAALVGATLELESMPGQGTTVYFRVPTRTAEPMD